MREQQRHWVRYFVDYFAPVAFMVAYFVTHDLLKATFAIVAGSVVAIVAGLIIERRLAPLPLFVGLMGLVFGGLTLIFHDPRIIKVKPTVVNLVLAAVLLGGLAFRKNPLKAVMGQALNLPDEVWRKLMLRFGLFYVFLATLNEAVWRTQTDEVWVLFRWPGLQILTVLFVLTQLPLLMRYAKPGDLPPPPTE